MQTSSCRRLSEVPLSKEIFDHFFGSSFITAPVSTKDNLVVDFNIGYDGDECFQWLDEYEDIAFIRTQSSQSNDRDHHQTENEMKEDECKDVEQETESEHSMAYTCYGGGL
eukprot:758648-Hanusia_phi.AAC.2